MRRVVPICSLILIVVTFLHPASAQTAKPTCDPATLIKQAAALAATGDPAKDMEALLTLRDSISAANIACNGMTFEGKGSKVIGPFEVKQGFYKGTITGGGTVLASVEAVRGCGESYEAPDMLLTKTTDNEAGESTMKVKQTCTIVIEVAIATGPWKITLEPL
jgi:hypothetical protein